MWPSCCHGCVCDFRWRCPYWSYYCDLIAGISLLLEFMDASFSSKLLKQTLPPLKFKSTMFFLVHPLLPLVCHCPTRPFSSTEPETNIQYMVVNAFHLLNKPPTKIDPNKQHTAVPFLEIHSKDEMPKHVFSFGDRKGVWHPKILNTWRPGVGCQGGPQLNHRADQNPNSRGF